MTLSRAIAPILLTCILAAGTSAFADDEASCTGADAEGKEVTVTFGRGSIGIKRDGKALYGYYGFCKTPSLNPFTTTYYNFEVDGSEVVVHSGLSQITSVSIDLKEKNGSFDSRPRIQIEIQEPHCEGKVRIGSCMNYLWLLM